MKNIEIKTTQNVVLEYELADLRDRILAFLLDLIILVIGILILSAVDCSWSTAPSNFSSIVFSETKVTMLFLFP